MTVYSELLKLRLGGRVDSGRPVGALVAELLIRRPRARAAADDPRALCDVLAYDETLVRLCHCLGVDQHLLEPFSPPTAREHAERALARRLPLLAILEEAPSD